MPDINAWLSSAKGRIWFGDQQRAASVGEIILDKPATITILRDDTWLAPQVVRLDTLNTTFDEAATAGTLGSSTRQRMSIVGYKNHPSVPDTDIDYKDRFPYDGKYWIVEDVQATFADRVLAIARAID